MVVTVIVMVMAVVAVMVVVMVVVVGVKFKIKGAHIVGILVCRPVLNPLSHTSQGVTLISAPTV